MRLTVLPLLFCSYGIGHGSGILSSRDFIDLNLESGSGNQDRDGDEDE